MLTTREMGALNLPTASLFDPKEAVGKFAAVEENLSHISEQLKSVFAAFANNLKYVDANAPAQIERMKKQITSLAAAMKQHANAGAFALRTGAQRVKAKLAERDGQFRIACQQEMPSAAT